MTEDAITDYLIDMLAGGHFQIADDNTFFFHDADNKFPFATIVTKDSEFDNASKLDRPGAFRLNIGVGKESFRALFGEAPAAAADPAALDTLMPHPVYGKMYWVSVISPSTQTFDKVKPLLAEALALARARKPG
ncbi:MULTISPECIES: DUF6194 family protein [Variovorax]|jgi:hypothetical protein|uniref:DUF6194 family protein n=1 Tax=Variovorax TaxID=34072 RepID=UPI00086B3B19|nr:MULTISPECIES: DUF6194 family protein [Variovorax]MBN8751745.1 hypothetical protein [Variovorax sp.]ODU13327.1 MAG: hypothetical protein ABS94_27235 [Variovorax sp. SCN 67-85]ODV16228.1 MAG: hypothetical protein ABT25_31680 [Variovorax sp. SCN 67-20]OJZ11661.1 MAG: hypothetical protein BGP22_10095 [Variovorax sp. 67-131]UKI05670.1 DUF6194 family protein [Variovorax paradoxus]